MKQLFRFIAMQKKVLRISLKMIPANFNRKATDAQIKVVFSNSVHPWQIKTGQLKNGILFLFIAVVMMACGNNSPKEERPAEKTTTAPPVHIMDMLEKIFNNDNWMKTGDGDTSYFYFSRIPSEMQVHQYKMIKGDSVITNLSSVRFAGDSLIWQYNDSVRLFLGAVTNESAEWDHLYKEGRTTLYLAFEKKDEKHIKLTDAGKKQFLLTKTPTLSTFLIRSRYDYLHGTKYAFTDTVFSVEKKK